MHSGKTGKKNQHLTHGRKNLDFMNSRHFVRRIRTLPNSTQTSASDILRYSTSRFGPFFSRIVGVLTVGTFRVFCTERARLGTFRGLGTERARLGTFNPNLSFRHFLKNLKKMYFFTQKDHPAPQKLMFCIKESVTFYSKRPSNPAKN